MILLKSLINEIKSDAYSWQKPDGQFIPVIQNHGADAYEYVKGSRKDDHIMILWKSGWQRVTYISDMGLYVHNEIVPPNEKQKKKLIDLAIELNLPKLEWDGGDRERVLWSVNDVVENQDLPNSL